MKNKKITYLTLIFAFFSQLLAGQQTYFSKIFNPYNTVAISRHIVVLDTGYLIGGLIKDSSTQINTLAILITDNNGNLIDIKKPGKTGFLYGSGSSGSFYKLLDNSYIWAGQIRTSIKDYGFLIKLDSSLNKVWEREFMFNNDTVYSYLGVLQSKQTYDQGYILVGDIDGSGQYNSDILLIKTDSFGNKEWQKTYNFIGADRGWNVIQTPDKGYLIGAGGYIAGNTQSYNGLIIKTDSLGNEKWRKVIGDIYKDYYCVVKNSNDGNIIVGTTTALGQSSPEYPYRRIRLLKISPTGVIIWDKYYGPTRSFNGIGQVIVLKNDDIVAAGFYLPDTFSVYQGDTWGWILKTNSNGDSMWMHEYYRFNGHANVNRFYDIKQTQDGGFITCGQVDSTNVPQHIWVMKLDSFGCDTPGCHTVGIEKAKVESKKAKVWVYPNPASDEINIDFTGFTKGETINIVIYNSVGLLIKQVKTAKNINTKTINIKDLKQGIYYYQIISNSRAYSGKFVKM